MAAVVVARRQLDRQIHEAELFVHGDLSPRAGVAGVGRRVLLPGVASVLAELRNRVEDPQALARAHVEAADVALLVAAALGIAAGSVRGADDDDVFRDRRRRVESDLARDEIHLLVVVFFQIDDAALAERRDRRAGFRVQRDKAIAWRDVENAFVARVVAPVREAAPRQLPRRVRAARALVLAVHPQHLAGGRVERDHGAPRSAGRVDDALHHQRRRLELELGPRTEIVGLEPPGDLELAEVARVDLIERRVPRMRDVAAVAAPLAVLRAGLPRHRRERRHDDACRRRKRYALHAHTIHPSDARLKPRAPFYPLEREFIRWSARL